MSLYLSYLLLVIVVVGASILTSRYVDMLDRQTGLSGALLGGVLLAAVTSLPELFTSMAAVVFLDQPGLTLGNVLGSNLFNLAMLGTALFLAPGLFLGGSVAKSHSLTTALTLGIYLVMALGILFGVHAEIFTVDAISIIVALIYGGGVYALSRDAGDKTSEAHAPAQHDVPPPADSRRPAPAGLGLRLILCCLVLVAASTGLTFATDALADRLNLGAGLAGALFLGIATSLPELTATVTLIRLRNINLVIGNLAGSNLFNFLIVSIADVLYFRGTVYLTDAQSRYLLECGALASILTLAALLIRPRLKSRLPVALFGLAIVGAYAAFLFLAC